MYEILNPDLSWAGEMKQVSMDNHSIHWQTAGTLTLIATATEISIHAPRGWSDFRCLMVA